MVVWIYSYSIYLKNNYFKKKNLSFGAPFPHNQIDSTKNQFGRHIV